MKIREILRRKGHDVVTIARDRSVLEAARALVQHDIGALPVMEGAQPIGIISERDILRLAASARDHLGAIPVGSVMTRKVVTATPDDDLHELMGVMTERRIRHLPVLAGERLVGIVSIGDLLNACHLLAEEENAYLREYIHGAG